MIYRKIFRRQITLNIESTLQQTTLDRCLLVLDKMQRIIVYSVTIFGFISSIGSTVSSKHDHFGSLDDTSKVDISLFRKKSDSNIELLNYDAGNGIHTNITNDDKRDDNIGKPNDVPEEQGLTESFATELEEIKEDTKDHYEDIDDIDNDHEDNVYNFHESLYKVRQKAARVTKDEDVGHDLHDVKDDDTGLNRRRFAAHDLFYLKMCCWWRWW